MNFRISSKLMTALIERYNMVKKIGIFVVLFSYSWLIVGVQGNSDNLALKNDIKNTCKQLRNNAIAALQHKEQWLDDAMPEESFFTSNREKTFVPYFQKIVFGPEESKQKKIIAIADLHGDINSLNALIKHLQDQKIFSVDIDTPTIIDPNTIIVFTGDFVDRGNHGIATLLKVLKLRIKNPETVFLCRGNHEDFNMNLQGGFHHELCTQFNLSPQNKKDFKFLCSVYGIYKYLPSAIFIGTHDENGHTNFFKFCHGGFDLGSNPKELLAAPKNIQYMPITKLLRKTNLENIYKQHKNLQICCPLSQLLETYEGHIQDQPVLPAAHHAGIGEMWGDVSILEQWCPDILMCEGHRGEDSVEYSKELLELLYKEASSENATLYATIRGHQHGPETLPTILDHKGVHCAWTVPQEDVCAAIPLTKNAFITIAPAPASYAIYNYSYIPYAELQLATSTLTPHKVHVQ